MATTLITKNSSVAAAEPLPGDLTEGELAVNTTDGTLFTKNSGGSVVTLLEPLTKAAVDALNVDAATLDGVDSTGFLLAAGTAADSDALGGVAASSYTQRTSNTNIAANWEWQDNDELNFGNGKDVSFYATGLQLNTVMYDTGGEYWGIYDNGTTVQRFLFRQQGGFTAGLDIPDQDQFRGFLCAYGGNASYSGSYSGFTMCVEDNNDAILALISGSSSSAVVKFADSASTTSASIGYDRANNCLEILTPGGGEFFMHDTYGTIHTAVANPLDDGATIFGIYNNSFNCGDSRSNSTSDPQLNIADASSSQAPILRFSRCMDDFATPAAAVADDVLMRIDGSVYDGVAAGAGQMNDGVFAIEAVATETHSTTQAGSKLTFSVTDSGALTNTTALELTSSSVNTLVPLAEGYHLNGFAETNVDLSLGAYHKMVPSSSKTFAFTNPPASGVAATLFIELAPTGSATITWPASVQWRSGTAPTTPTSGNTSIYAFVTHDGGTTWFGSEYGADFA